MAFINLVGRSLIFSCHIVSKVILDYFLWIFVYKKSKDKTKSKQLEQKEQKRQKQDKEKLFAKLKDKKNSQW
jgi:hypothetical protein